VIFQAYVLTDDDTLEPLGDVFAARTSLDAVQQARELWPGLSPVVSEVKSAVTEGD
jgi:hypothetical protein